MFKQYFLIEFQIMQYLKVSYFKVDYFLERGFFSAFWILNRQEI